MNCLLYDYTIQSKIDGNCLSIPSKYAHSFVYFSINQESTLFSNPYPASYFRTSLSVRIVILVETNAYVARCVFVMHKVPCLCHVVSPNSIALVYMNTYTNVFPYLFVSIYLYVMVCLYCMVSCQPERTFLVLFDLTSLVYSHLNKPLWSEI